VTLAEAMHIDVIDPKKTLRGACGSIPATASAQLLDGRELEMIGW